MAEPINWKKMAKPVLIGIAVVLVSFVVASYMLPRYGTAFRTIEIGAPPEKVYAAVSDLRNFNAWSPWYGRDPAAVYTFTGPTDGTGQTLNWKSDDPRVGSGSMEIKKLDPNHEVEMEVVFVGEGKAKSWLVLEPNGEVTKVTWGFMTDLGFNPIARVWGIGMDGMVGSDYFAGLKNLKALLEKPAEPAPAPG